MVRLVGMQGFSGGGVDWQITRLGDPSVLTMVFPERVATDATIPDVSLPEVFGQEAWTIDFDAVRAHLHPEGYAQLPACASGQVSVTPSEMGPQVRFDITPEMFG